MNENIYSEVMYAVLDNINKEHRDSDSKPENIVGGLISTGHSYLIDHIVGNENLTRQTFKEVLEGYFQTGQLKKFLEILNQYPEQKYHNFNLEKYIEKLVQKESSEEDILDFAKYILSLGYESTSHINKLLETLWENKQFEIAKKIIDDYLSPEEQSIFNIIHNLYQGKVPTSKEIVDAIEKISDIQSKNNEKNRELSEKISEITTFLLTELEKNNASIPILKSLIVVCENKKLGNPLGIFGEHELDKKIREYYYKRKEWKEAEEFINATGGYYKSELMNKKFDYAIEEKNRELYEETLKDYIYQQDKKIEKIIQEPNKWESVVENHSNLCKAHAEKNCELAIFELLYGEQEKAQEYISLMVQFTESITENIPEGCLKNDKDIIKLRIKRPFKKELKERFLNLGLFQYLPKEYGWNSKIKDPQQREGEREKKNNERYSERLKNEKEELEKTQWVQLLLNENDIDEAIKYIAKDSAWYTSRENWERGMLILDYSPDSFQEIFRNLSRECFKKSSAGDYSDYESMSQFFAKGLTLGVVKDEEWKDLLYNVRRSRGGEYGDGYIFYDLITSLIKYIIEVGEVGKAWELFKNSKEDMDKSSISSCLYYLINASSNPIRKDVSTLAFNNRDLGDEYITYKEKIKYWNTRANIDCSFQDEGKYNSSILELQKTIKISEDPTQAIRTWCKDLVNHCLRNHHQIKDELEVFLNSDFGESEEIRRRIIYTLIELKVPGMEAIDDVKRKDLPLRVQYLFFKKLVQSGYLSRNTNMFLGKDWEKHMPYLNKLLNQNLKEFNLIVDIINKNDENIHSAISYRTTEEERKEAKEKLFKVSGWENIFKVLDAFNKYEVDYTCVLNNIDKINKHPRGLYFGYFSEAIKNGINVEESDINKFPITIENFLDLMKGDDVLMTFAKDASFKKDGLKPWSKKWFLEKPERKTYLKPENMKTFMKFGTIIGLGIIEGSQDTPHLKKFYSYIFSNISPEVSRSSILQLGELFNLILKRENYSMLDELVNNEVAIGSDFRNFVEENKISDKGRTILTLMIAREINHSFSIFKDSSGNTQIDKISVKEMLLSVYTKFKKYKEIINIYKDVPMKTSIGIEYEVTRNTAKGYRELTGSDYKNDIEIMSEYSGIGRGRDAIHEIATKPSDNPYLLLLELKLLEDIDFLDLNFKREDYKNGARGFHISLGGEYGISLDANAYFIRNILLAGNLGGLNVGEKINNGGGIRNRDSDCDTIFGIKRTGCLEYRSFSIDKSEPFERLILSIFNLNMAKQMFDKYFGDKTLETYDSVEKFNNFEQWKIFLEQKNIGEPQIKDKRIYEIIFHFLKLRMNIINLLKEHNSNFLKNESFHLEEGTGMDTLLMILTSTGPIVQIIDRVGIDIYYFQKLIEDGIIGEEEFFERLENDGKNLNITERQKQILYGEYNLKIRPNLEKLKTKNAKVYKNIGEYLNGNTTDTLRKITNFKRFVEVIGSDEKYFKNIIINPEAIFQELSTDLINKFTNINNLFVKKDSTNALSMFDTTREEDGSLISDSRLTETMIFDKIDRGFKQRSGYNIIQGASEKMLTQAIQRKILEFNKNIGF